MKRQNDKPKAKNEVLKQLTESHMNFVPGLKPVKPSAEPALWFAFHNDRLLIKNERETYVIPQAPDFETCAAGSSKKHYIGSLDGRHCWAVELVDAGDQFESFEFMGLRALFGALAEDFIWIAGRANQIVNWSLSHQFCGKCGQPTQDKEDERAKICPRCAWINYPRISPAIIVAVVKGNHLLLARSPRFKSNFYSVLAGFVEPGENLEDCVQREIREEVGIKVKNIRYFGSQPWPFPDSLMIAFTAEYAEDKLRIDNSEIVDAGWFAADDLPPVPPKISIARQLIDWFTTTFTYSVK